MILIVLEPTLTTDGTTPHSSTFPKPSLHTPSPTNPNSNTHSLILAGTKFSIRSRINQKTPTLQPFLRLCCDQITIANDLASYDKEQRDFDAGRIKSMINIVTVIQRIDHLSTPVAKAMAYARQLYIENELLLELHALKTRAELSAEEWMFVQAFLATAAGNLLNSVVISRYGGEDARV